MFDIEWIIEKARSSQYYFSKHGDNERQNDNLTVEEVEEALVEGRILDNIPTQEEVKAAWLLDSQKQGSQFTLCVWQACRHVVHNNSVSS